MDYLITVIIPIYNAEQYIARCARSLFEQTFQNIQYIFVDDCSSDNSLLIVKELLEEYPSRKSHTRFFTNAENIGAAGTRNAALEKAQGHYVTFCDADDWVDGEAYDELYQASESGIADILWCDYYNSFETHEVYTSQSIKTDSLICIKALLTEKMHGALWNKLFKRDLFVNNRVRFVEGLNMWEDLRLSIQLFYFSKSLAYVPRAYYHYVQYNEESLSNSNDEKKLDEILLNSAGIIEFLSEKKVGGLKKEIYIFKLAAKQTLLFKTQKEAFVKWRNIFPEANPYIWSFSSLPIHLRFIGWCAVHKIWPVIQIWIKFKEIRNKKTNLI